MKKLLSIFLLLFTGCSYHYIPVSNPGLKTYTFHSQKDFDAVWNNTLSFIGAKKYFGDSIAKEKGMIKTKKIDFRKYNPGYLEICKMTKNFDTTSTIPFRLFMNLNFSIRTAKTGTDVVIFLTPYYINIGNYKLRPEDKFREDWIKVVQSTGKFENEVFDQIK